MLGPDGPVHVGPTARELADGRPASAAARASWVGLPVPTAAYDWTLWPALDLLAAGGPRRVRASRRPARAPPCRSWLVAGWRGLASAPAGRLPADAAGARGRPPGRLGSVDRREARREQRRAEVLRRRVVEPVEQRRGCRRAGGGARSTYAAQGRPERASSPSTGAPRRAGCRPGCRPARSSTPRCSRRSSRSSRAGRTAARRDASRVTVAGDEVGGRLVGERLARLVVADQPVEPLVGRLVGDQVAQVRSMPTPYGIQMSRGDSIPKPPADWTTLNVGYG